MFSLTFTPQELAAIQVSITNPPKGHSTPDMLKASAMLGKFKEAITANEEHPDLLLEKAEFDFLKRCFDGMVWGRYVEEVSTAHEKIIAAKQVKVEIAKPNGAEYTAHN
jgi:hypothetical protein